MIAQPCSKSFNRPLKSRALGRTFRRSLALPSFISWPEADSLLLKTFWPLPLCSSKTLFLLNLLFFSSALGDGLVVVAVDDALSRSLSQKCDFWIFTPSCNKLLYSLPSLCLFVTLSLTDMNGLYKTSRCRSRAICAWHTYRATRYQRCGTLLTDINWTFNFKSI